MFIIPLRSRPSELEYAQNRSDIFDLQFDPSADNTYVGVVSNGLIVAGTGNIPHEFAFQYHTRDWVMGSDLNKTKAWGNVGFMGDFKSIDNAVSRTFPWKKEVSYCLNKGYISEYTGQKIKANKYHWMYAEPIMCCISDTPEESFNHFLDIIRYRKREDFVIRGNWKNGLVLYCDGKEMGLDSWYLEFIKRILS